MCGFIGEISKDDGNLDLLDKCNENLVCRGPDEKILKHNNTKRFQFKYDF